MGCLPPFEADQAQTFHLGVQSQGGEESAFHWEVYWTVQVVERGVLKEKFHGGLNTSLSFHYSPGAAGAGGGGGNYSFSAAELTGLWRPPSQMSCSEDDWRSRLHDGSGAPYSYGNETGLYASDGSGGYFETVYVITDLETRSEVLALGLPSSCVAGGHRNLSTCWGDGSYMLRALGGCDPRREQFQWDFCGVTDGHALQQLTFNVSGGVCHAGARQGAAEMCAAPPSAVPTNTPSAAPTVTPTVIPTVMSTVAPTVAPSIERVGVMTELGKWTTGSFRAGKKRWVGHQSIEHGDCDGFRFNTVGIRSIIQSPSVNSFNALVEISHPRRQMHVDRAFVNFTVHDDVNNNDYQFSELLFEDSEVITHLELPGASANGMVVGSADNFRFLLSIDFGSHGIPKSLMNTVDIEVSSFRLNRRNDWVLDAVDCVKLHDVGVAPAGPA
jgi:hypothetical protein